MIILTGGAGFIGSCFLARLNAMNRDDVLVVDNLGSSDKWKNLRGKRFIDYVHKEQFLRLLERDSFPQAEVLVHLGANSSTTERHVDAILDNNYRYSIRLAEWALQYDVRFIYASSAATYGSGEHGFVDDENQLFRLLPLNPYGYSKHLFDCWVHQHNLFEKFVGVKFFNVFGPNEYHKGLMRSVICKAYEEIRRTNTINLFKSYNSSYGDGQQLRDFIYVKDCVDVLVWFLEHREVSGLFNLGTGKARTWNDVAHALFRALDLPPAIRYIEMPDDIKPNYQYFTQAEMSKLRRAGYTAPFTSLEDAVSDYVCNYLHPSQRFL